MRFRSKKFEAVRARADRGELLDRDDMQVLLRLSRSAFYRYLKRGDFERFKAHPPIGARCYAGAIVARYLDGYVIEDHSVQPSLFDIKRRHA